MMMTSQSTGVNSHQDAIRTLNAAMGHVRGKVVDGSDRGLSGFRIRVRETGRTTRSDEKGDFVMINLPPASYTFVVNHKKYSLSVCRVHSVKAGDNPGFRFVMRPFRAVKRSFANNITGRLSLKMKEVPYGIPFTA